MGSTLCEASQSFWRLKFARGGRAPGSVSHRRAVRGEGDTGHPAARDRFPFENAGHLGHVPALESWRVAGERPEHCDLHRGRACPPCSAAGPRSWCRSNHLGPQILRDGMVLDCFPVERKRRLLKAYASHLRSGPGFERGIFARSILTSAHIAVAARKDALLRGEVLCEGNATMLAHQFYWKQDLYTADDVVLAQGVPVSLVCGLRVDDRMAAVVVPLELLSMSATFSTWRQRRHCASLLGGSGAATSSRSSLGDTGKDSVQQSAAVWKKPRLLFQRVPKFLKIMQKS